MQTSLENLGQLERRLTMAVAQRDIDSEVENRLKNIARTARISGFRPGKVPLKLVNRQFGSQVRQEVLGEALKKTFADAVKEQNLRVAGFPRFEAKSQQENGERLEFSATFEIYPEVVIGDLTKAAIQLPVLELTDADVDKTIEILRKRAVKFQPVARAAQESDQVNIDYRGLLDGAEFPGGKGEKFRTILGQGQLLPDFEKGVVGMHPGESRSIEFTFPEDYQGREVAGKKVAFDVTLNEVAQPVYPDVDAEFARGLGVKDGDLTKMRSEIRANLELEVKKRVRGRVKEQVAEYLVDATKIELPKALVDNEVRRLLAQAASELKSRGQEAPVAPHMFESQARRRVALGLIFAELVKANDLRAKPEQVRAIVEQFAQSYEHPAEVVKWYYHESQRLAEAEGLAVEENVVDWMLSKVKTENKPVSFDEIMGNA